MPVTLRVRNIQYLNELRNGPNFDINTSEFSRALVANVGERIRFKCEVEVFWQSEGLEGAEQVVLDADNIRITRSDGKSFINDGFRVGDGVQLQYIPARFGTITYVSDDEIDINEPAHGSSSNIYADPAVIRGDQPQKFMGYAYNLIEQDAPENYNSIFDDTTQSFIFENIGSGAPRSTSFITGSAQGNAISWVTGQIRARYLTNRADVQHYKDSTFISANTVQVFEIEQDLIIVPFGLNVGTIDQFEGNRTLKHVFEMKFRNNSKRSDTEKAIKYEGENGNVGYYNENFNGFDNDYTIIERIYTDQTTNNPVDRLEAGATTRVRLTITAANGATFQGGQPVVIGHSKIPELEEYDGASEDFQSIWLYDTKRITTGTPPVSSDIIQNAYAQLISSTEIVVEYSVSFSTDQLNRISDGDRYHLFVNLEDDSLTAENSNRVNLLIDDNNYYKNTDIPGLATLDSFTITDLNGVDHSNYIGSVEDQIILNIGLSLDLSKNAVINEWRAGTFGYNATTGDIFEIETYPLDNNFDLINGIQLIDSVDSTGYDIENENRNIISVKSGTISGDFQPYEIKAAIKIPWQDEQEIDAPDAFHPIKTKNASNYSEVNGYEVVFGISAIIESEGIETDYYFLNQGNEIKNYAEGCEVISS